MVVKENEVLKVAFRLKQSMRENGNATDSNRPLPLCSEEIGLHHSTVCLSNFSTEIKLNICLSD